MEINKNIDFFSKFFEVIIILTTIVVSYFFVNQIESVVNFNQDSLELQSILIEDDSLSNLKYKLDYDLKKDYIENYNISTSNDKINIICKNNLNYEIYLNEKSLPINNESVILSNNYVFLNSKKEKYLDLNTSLVCKNSKDMDSLKIRLDNLKKYAKKNNIKYVYNIIRLDNSFVLEYSINGNLNSIYFLIKI